VDTGLALKVGILCIAVVLVACNKKDASAGSASVNVSPAVAAIPAPRSSPAPENLRFTAEVVAHEEFQKTFAPKLIFRLEPYAGADSGWSIRIAPMSESGGPAIDCIGAVEAPLHGDTKIEIEPADNDSRKSPAWRQRNFEYVATASECRSAWELMNNANYNAKLSEAEREQASVKLGQVPRRRGKFAILDARFGPATSQNAHGTIEWLKFEVDLGGNSEKTAADARTASANSAIRSIDLKPFIESHLGELNPDLADLETDCGEGQKSIQSLAPLQYGDLDGDGQQEAAFLAWTCLSGNGGADLFGVLKRMPDGKLTALPIEPIPKLFKGRNPSENLRGHMNVKIREGRLVQMFPVYASEEACNNCAEGERDLVYRWDGHRFALDDIIEVPPQKSAP
jgi:hypothetical protein